MTRLEMKELFDCMSDVLLNDRYKMQLGELAQDDIILKRLGDDQEWFNFIHVATPIDTPEALADMISFLVINYYSDHLFDSSIKVYSRTLNKRIMNENKSNV